MPEDDHVFKFHSSVCFSESALDDFDKSFELHRCILGHVGKCKFGLDVCKSKCEFFIDFWILPEIEGVSLERINSLTEWLRGSAKITAVNSSPTRNYWTNVNFGIHVESQFPSIFAEAMVWDSSTRADLESEGWLTRQGVLNFRVEVNLSACLQKMIASTTVPTWGPEVCANQLWHAREFADFTILVENNQEIQCHRAVLSAASPVFRGMMSGEWEESMQTLEKRDVSAEVMSLLLQYIYLGHLPFDVDCIKLLRLTELADYYELPGLIHHCASRIPHLVCEANVVEVLRSLSPLSQANIKIDALLRVVIQAVQHDMELLFTVCTSWNKPVSEGMDDDSSTLNDPMWISTTLAEHAVLNHQHTDSNLQQIRDDKEDHDAVGADILGGSGTSTVSCQSLPMDDSSHPPLKSRPKPSPHGFNVSGHPDSTDTPRLRGDGLNPNGDVVKSRPSGSSMPPGEESHVPLTQSTLAHVEESTLAQSVNCSELVPESCLQRRRPRRKTRRGGSRKKTGAGQDPLDMSFISTGSVPGTHNSWD